LRPEGAGGAGEGAQVGHAPIPPFPRKRGKEVQHSFAPFAFFAPLRWV
jgi:hypothetical protein